MRIAKVGHMPTLFFTNETNRKMNIIKYVVPIQKTNMNYYILESKYSVKLRKYSHARVNL